MVQSSIDPSRLSAIIFHLFYVRSEIAPSFALASFDFNLFRVPPMRGYHLFKASFLSFLLETNLHDDLISAVWEDACAVRVCVWT